MRCKPRKSLIFWIMFCLFLNACSIIHEPGTAAAKDPAGIPEKGMEAGRPASGNRATADNASPVPVSVAVEDAVLTALENNQGLQVERLNPPILGTFEEQELAVFDPLIDAEVSYFREKGLEDSTARLGLPESELNLDLGVSRFFPTGTNIRVDIDTGRLWTDRFGDRDASRVGLSVTQALLQGRGSEVNLANVRQARIGVISSLYELRGFSEALIAQVQESYWDYALAQRRIRIFEESMRVAEQQLEETLAIVAVGRLAETEIVAAEAEIALRRQELIEAQSEMELTRLRLLRLLNPPVSDMWDRDVILLDEPVVPEVELDDVDDHVRLAMRMRPELNQARLQVDLENLEVVKTKNGLLPRMDFFISLGKTGYAESFGSSIRDISDDGYDVLGGIRFLYPWRNRAPRAVHERAVLTREQAQEALANLSQLVELDVREAFIEINRASRQIHASRATLQLEEEKVRMEVEKFRVGKSTSFLVAQAQRDLLRARILEIESVVNYLKALVNLYRLDGSLLERWGISLPGEEPVSLGRQEGMAE